MPAPRRGGGRESRRAHASPGSNGPTGEAVRRQRRTGRRSSAGRLSSLAAWKSVVRPIVGLRVPIRPSTVPIPPPRTAPDASEQCAADHGGCDDPRAHDGTPREQCEQTHGRAGPTARPRRSSHQCCGSRVRTASGTEMVHGSYPIPEPDGAIGRPPKSAFERTVLWGPEACASWGREHGCTADYSMAGERIPIPGPPYGACARPQGRTHAERSNAVAEVAALGVGIVVACLVLADARPWHCSARRTRSATRRYVVGERTRAQCSSR